MAFRPRLPHTLPLLAVVWLLVAIVYVPGSIPVGRDKPDEPVNPEPRPAQPAQETWRTTQVMPQEEKLKDAVGPMLMPPPALQPALTRRIAKPRHQPRRRARRSRSSDSDIYLYSFPRVKDYDSSKHFIVRGRLFDLKTLKPVRGAKVYFRHVGDEGLRIAVTDSRGEYEAALNASINGYYVSIKRTGYSPNYVEDFRPSLTLLDAANRRDVAASYRKGPQRTFVLAKSGDALKKDFALIRR